MLHFNHSVWEKKKNKNVINYLIKCGPHWLKQTAVWWRIWANFTANLMERFGLWCLWWSHVIFLFRLSFDPVQPLAMTGTLFLHSSLCLTVCLSIPRGNIKKNYYCKSQISWTLSPHQLWDYGTAGWWKSGILQWILQHVWMQPVHWSKLPLP